MSSKQSASKRVATRKKPVKSGFLVLAIETSCDETAVSVVAFNKNLPTILSDQVSSQVKLHAKWGGVVPNLAAREHVKNIDLMLKNALQEAQILPADIDAIAVTQGPGLIPALLVGVNYAKTLSYLWEKPLIGVHHIEGHIFANFVSENPKSEILNPKQISNTKSYKLKANEAGIKFPILCLVVSGGHTQLVLMKNHFDYEIVGQTVDDAVGEAFDKVARILGIGYPGGPNVAAWAAKFQISNFKFQNENNSKIENSEIDSKFKIQNSKFEIHFPRPMLSKQNFNFSFSGLKTAVLYETKKHPESVREKKYITEVCHEFQQACVDVLVAKTIKAGEKYQPKTILLAGGVSANTELRQQLGQAIEKNMPATSYCIPALNLTGDNAGMIGIAGAFRWDSMTDTQKKSALENWKTLQPNANLKMQ